MSGIRIKASADEAALVCASVARVVSYFGEAGLDVVPRGTISFVDEIRDTRWAHPPHGYFELRDFKIVIVRGAADRWWGLGKSEELLGSLHHELSHMAVAVVMGERFKTLPASWQEFVAYAVQLDLLDTEIRNEVLARNPQLKGFQAFADLNDYVVGFLAPEQMALMSYKAYQAWGGQEFLGRLLRFEVDVGCMADMTSAFNQPSCRR